MTERDLSRYIRQTSFDRMGLGGQQRLLDSRVAVVGVGALGSVMANMLARAGVGFMRLIDFDRIELDNLQRQALYTEEDVARKLPKAEAAAAALRAVNSDVTVETVVEKLEPANAERLLSGVDLVLDGVDNFAGRFLINDFCVRHAVPWIYGAVAGSYGLTMPILPGETACLRCLFGEIPPTEHTDTARTAGILAATVNVVASLQVVEALKILTGQADQVRREMAQVDVWDCELELVAVPRRASCKACAQRSFEFLE